jgi:hypothetical protein
MKISELVKILNGYKRKHGDLLVVYTRYSDLGVMDDSDVSLIDATPVKGAAGKWMVRSTYGGGPIPSDHEKVVYFAGN